MGSVYRYIYIYTHIYNIYSICIYTILYLYIYISLYIYGPLKNRVKNVRAAGHDDPKRSMGAPAVYRYQPLPGPSIVISFLRSIALGAEFYLDPKNT